MTAAQAYLSRYCCPPALWLYLREAGELRRFFPIGKDATFVSGKGLTKALALDTKVEPDDVRSRARS